MIGGKKGGPPLFRDFGLVLPDGLEVEVEVIARHTVQAQRSIATALRAIKARRKLVLDNSKAEKALRSASSILGGECPASLCPTCKALPITCHTCHGRRWITRDEATSIKFDGRLLLAEPLYVVLNREVVTYSKARKAAHEEC